MEHDKLLYLSTLLISLLASEYINKLKNPKYKKIFGSSIGIILIILLFGRHTVHCVMITIVNILIIQSANENYVHVYSFALTWSYLLYLHSSYASLSRNTVTVYMFISLRLVGYAYEVNLSYKIRNRCHSCMTTSVSLNRVMKVYDMEKALVSKPDMYDAFSYVFNFIGLHRGPYYTIQSFNDYMKTDSDTIVDSARTYYNIKLIVIMAFVETVIKIITNNRIVDVVTTFVMNQLIINICESMYIETGFNQFNNPSLYNVRNRANQDTAISTMIFDVFKNYNRNVFSWFWYYIYATVPFQNKNERIGAAVLCWCVWSGVTFGSLYATLFYSIFLTFENVYIFRQIENILEE